MPCLSFINSFHPFSLNYTVVYKFAKKMNAYETFFLECLKQSPKLLQITECIHSTVSNK